MSTQYNLPSPSAPFHHELANPHELQQPFLEAGAAGHEESVNGSSSSSSSYSSSSSSPGSGSGSGYVSQTKARQYNKLRLCGIPFNFFILMSICWLTFGSYWVYDTPGAIEDQLHAYFNRTAHIDYTKSMNLNLYSIYSWPNTLLAFFGGFIIDRITGIRAGTFLFGALIFCGQTLFALGIQYQQYWVCFAGRFVFGLGGESLTVAQNFFTVRWFDGPVLALVFGIVVAFSRIGSSVNFIVTPPLANGPGVPFSVWFGVAMCGISLVSCVCAWLLDLWGDGRISEERAVVLSSLSAEDALAAENDDKQQNDEEEEFVNNCCSRRCPTYFWNDIVREFGIKAWLLFAITLFFYVSVLNFYQVASDIMQKTGNHYSNDTASLFLAVPNIVAIVASPTFGYLVDKKGRALYWICMACTMVVIAHAVFLALAYEWIHIHPAIIMVWLGFAYSLGAAPLWPILAYIIPTNKLGTAYGCMTAVQNTGLAVFPLVIGHLQDAFQGRTLQYTLPILIFIGCAAIAFTLAVLLMGIDRATGGRLNASAAERALMLKLQQEAEAEAEAAASQRN